MSREKSLGHPGSFSRGVEFELFDGAQRISQQQAQTTALNITYTVSGVHQFLDEFGIENWVVYGSVFGSVREHGPQQWDNDIAISF